jgi:hypothetical protein
VDQRLEDIARQAIADFNRVCDGRFEIDDEGRSRWVEDPMIVPMRAALEGTEWRGPTALDEFAAANAEAWERLHIETQGVRALDDTSALIYGDLTAVARGTGIVTRAPLVFHMTVRDGLIASFRTFHSEDAALKDVAS